jgi:hypothetical protein
MLAREAEKIALNDAKALVYKRRLTLAPNAIASAIASEGLFVC